MFEGSEIGLGFLVFGLGLAVDLVYVHWTVAATNNKARKAAILAATIQLFGTGGLLFVVREPVLLTANVLGHAVGSYIGVRLAKPTKSMD